MEHLFWTITNIVLNSNVRDCSYNNSNDWVQRRASNV